MSIVPVYAEPEEIVALIRDASKKPGKDYVIVDVRGDDYNVITENCTEIYCICWTHITLGRSPSWCYQCTS